MNLTLTKKEVQELKLWGIAYKEKTIEVGMKWEDDQENLMNKLRGI